MKTPTPIFISTRQFAELAGVHDSVLHAAVSRKGHYKGVHPQRRGDSTGFAWPAEQAYTALGLIGPASSRTAGDLQRQLTDEAGSDPLSAFKAARWLTDQRRSDAPAAESLAAMLDDVAIGVGLVDAMLARVQVVLTKHEAAVTPATWAALQGLAHRLANAVEGVTRCGGWQLVGAGGGAA